MTKHSNIITQLDRIADSASPQTNRANLVTHRILVGGVACIIAGVWLIFSQFGPFDPLSIGWSVSAGIGLAVAIVILGNVSVIYDRWYSERAGLLYTFIQHVRRVHDNLVYLGGACTRYAECEDEGERAVISAITGELSAARDALDDLTSSVKKLYDGEPPTPDIFDFIDQLETHHPTLLHLREAVREMASGLAGVARAHLLDGTGGAARDIVVLSTISEE